MSTVIIIAIIIAVLYFVTKVAIGGAENKSNSQSGTKSQSSPIQKQEPTEIKIPSTEDGYFYHGMVGMYHLGVAPSEFGIYEGYAMAEKNNPHDKFAVGIYRSKDNKLVGYVPREERGESNESLHKVISYEGGTAKAVFKIQGSAQRSYGTVYIKEGYKVFRNGDTKSPYKSKGVKEFQFEALKGVSGKHKCFLKINSQVDEYDYTVCVFDESDNLIGETDNNELRLFDYVEERGNNVLSWCCIDAESNSGILYVPLNLTEKAIYKKLHLFLEEPVTPHRNEKNK